MGDETEDESDTDDEATEDEDEDDRYDSDATVYDDEDLDSLVQGVCPGTTTTAAAAANDTSMFSRLPDNVVVMILRRADYDLNVLRTCKRMSALGSDAFADYWLGRIIRAEETTLNHEDAPHTSKVSKRWGRADSVKVQTDGRSAATRRMREVARSNRE